MSKGCGGGGCGLCSGSWKILWFGDGRSGSGPNLHLFMRKQVQRKVMGANSHIQLQASNKVPV